jgi:hypothetical protein
MRFRSSIPAEDYSPRLDTIDPVPRESWWSILRRWLLRGVAVLAGIVLLGAGLLLVLLNSAWPRERLRTLVLARTAPFLDGTLDIGALDGSLTRDLRLERVAVRRDGRTLIEIDEVAVSYDLRRLLAGEVVIDRVTLTRPRVTGTRLGDGRWDLATLVRLRGGAGGSPPPIHLPRIEVIDGTVHLASPLGIGGVTVPADMEALDATLAFRYQAGAWAVDLAGVSWIGRNPDFSVTALSGGVARDGDETTLTDWSIATAASRVSLAGTVVRAEPRSRMALHVAADPFSFQEYAAILPGLRRIDIVGAFDVTLSGTGNALDADLTLRSNGGNARGRVRLDTTVPGWHGAGEFTVDRIDLSRWLSRPDRPSDATGRVVFDLDLNFGRGLPVGPFTFDGGRLAFLDYAATSARVRGRMASEAVVLDRVTARVYGAEVTLTEGHIQLASPYGYRFVGAAARLDLRNVPESAPVPHVESRLHLTFDVDGRFERPVIAGRAVTLPESTFLGAPLDEGTTGTIDTTGDRLRYRASGGVTGLSLQRVATDLRLSWLDDSRYAGVVTGRFQVEGDGSAAADTRLVAQGRLVRGERLLGGMLSDADVTVEISDGSIAVSYTGRFDHLDPSLVTDDPRVSALLSGNGRLDMVVHDLLLRPPTLDDFTLDADITLSGMSARGVTATAGRLSGRLAAGVLTVAHLHAEGPDFDVTAAGTASLAPDGEAALTYLATGVDLALLSELTGRTLSGQVDTSGRASGPTRAPRLVGSAVVSGVRVDTVGVAGARLTYDVQVGEDGTLARVRADGGATYLEIGGSSFDSLGGSFTYDGTDVSVDLTLEPRAGVRATVAGTARLDLETRALQVWSLDVVVQERAWRLDAVAPRPTVTWTDAGFATTRAILADPEDGLQRVAIEGSWLTSGGGEVRIDGREIYLDRLAAVDGRPSFYGGLLEFDAVVTGDGTRPIVTGSFTVTDGRVGRLSYTRLLGQLEYVNGLFEGGLHLDQGPGVWLSASGAAPLSLLDRSLPEARMHVAIASSAIDLGLLEGVTDLLDNVVGRMQLELALTGTSHHPVVTGLIDFSEAGFLVVPTGVRYQNGRGLLELESDRVVIQTLRIEDRSGRVIEATGTAGVKDFALGEFTAAIVARRAEILRNPYGTAEVDGRLEVAGPIASPRITGSVTVTSGQLDIGRLVDQALFQPYATEARSPLAELDALRVINPWEELGLDVEVRVPGTMRMVGENLQVSPGAPLGLGDFNLRATGDLYFYKDPAQPLYVTGSLDQITGAYSFQGRRFELDPASSIVFRGDLSPELYVTVHRTISGVETTVNILGPLYEPELRLSSQPPLDSSDILSLIVFNTSSNDLSAVQQNQLAVRAGTLAAGFLVAPLVTALERSLGIDTLEIEPGSTTDSGPRVTIGDEIAPGLVARFSRQFGINEYDEATIEYFLSRLLRIRATFTDAGGQVGLSPFHRVERAGIDLLVFFSF